MFLISEKRSIILTNISLSSIIRIILILIERITANGGNGGKNEQSLQFLSRTFHAPS